MKIFIHTLFFFLLVMQICFAQWVQLGLEDKVIKDIVARNSTIFAVTTDSALYRSTDNGINWLQIIDSGATDIAITPSGLCFMIRSYSQFIWEPYDSLYRSSDNGNTWVNLNIVEQIPPPAGFIARPTNVRVSPLGFIFCGLFRTESFGGGDYGTDFAMSSDEGLTWTTSCGGGGCSLGGDLFDFRGQSVITSGYSCWGSNDDCNTAVYLSSDNGQTWLPIGYTLSIYNNVLSICLNGNIITGSCDLWWYPGLFLSADSCKTWTQISPLIIEAGLSIESGGVLVGTDTLGVFLFSDNGDSIGSRNEGLTNLNIQSLTLDNNGYVYAGTGIGIWRRPLSEIVTSAEEVYTQPTEFILEQNYPNPFNPNTKIKFSIPQSSQVIIKVFDVLGNEIETLVNEEKPAGTYELTWNATNLPSGVYFYQLKAGEFTAVKKMILLK